MRGNETLDNVATLLRELGGYFTFIAQDGEEYIVAAKKDVSRIGRSDQVQPELQLPLPPAASNQFAANELLDRINRDIALYQAVQEQFDDVDIVVEDNAAPNPAPTPPPRRVRFEPLRGDLPPELQE